MIAIFAALTQKDSNNYNLKNIEFIYFLGPSLFLCFIAWVTLLINHYTIRDLIKIQYAWKLFLSCKTLYFNNMITTINILRAPQSMSVQRYLTTKPRIAFSLPVNVLWPQ